MRTGPIWPVFPGLIFHFSRGHAGLMLEMEARMQEQQQVGKARIIGYSLGIALVVIVVLAKLVLKV